MSGKEVGKNIEINGEWHDFAVLATGDGEKLERWGKVILRRPDPQVIWRARAGGIERTYKADAVYRRSSTGGGAWEFAAQIPEQWQVGWRNLKFLVKPMGFKHTGLFPEQAANWSKMIELIEWQNRKISVLNLFAYTGGATVACASAGAEVCHVDSAKNMVMRAKENAALSGLGNASVRYIVDDCKKFIKREIARGKKYDAIIMDPPSYGRGPNGETWKLEEDIYDFCALAFSLLSESPLFVLINSYTTGLQPLVMKNLLQRILSGKFGTVRVSAYEVGLPTEESDVVLPCGASALALFD